MFCKTIDDRGLDGLTSAEIAGALGYKNLRTNTFSAAVSSARQFGFLAADGDALVLTKAARALLHPETPADVPRLLRRALVEPPLYASLAGRFAEKRVPEAAILANVLQRQDQITASAKLAAAEAFLESARFAGALGDDQIFRPNGAATRSEPSLEAELPRRARKLKDQADTGRVRLDLRLWGADQGKVVRLRAPESMTPESLERLVQAIRLHVRIEESVRGAGDKGG
jgi:hypothetical protein